MKHPLIILTILSIIAFTSSCNKPDSTSQQLEEAAANTETSVAEHKDFSFELKSEYVASMKAELDKMITDLDSIVARIEKSNIDSKTESLLKLKALKEQTNQLAQKLDEALNTSESTWDDFKSAYHSGVQDLETGIADARQWVSDIIEPS